MLDFYIDNLNISDYSYNHKLNKYKLSRRAERGKGLLLASLKFNKSDDFFLSTRR